MITYIEKFVRKRCKNINFCNAIFHRNHDSYKSVYCTSFGLDGMAKMYMIYFNTSNRIRTTNAIIFIGTYKDVTDYRKRYFIGIQLLNHD